MKKQLVLLGIIFLFVCIGLSGCDDSVEENRTGIPTLDPNFLISGLTILDNCESVYPELGTVWVNYTVTNFGGEGSTYVNAQVYQGILNFQLCGNGTIYNQTRMTWITLNQGESIDVSFVFPGIDCTNGTACYGYNYWI